MLKTHRNLKYFNCSKCSYNSITNSAHWNHLLNNIDIWNVITGIIVVTTWKHVIKTHRYQWLALKEGWENNLFLEFHDDWWQGTSLTNLIYWTCWFNTLQRSSHRELGKQSPLIKIPPWLNTQGRSWSGKSLVSPIWCRFHTSLSW